ncbi:MAG: SOS response-associated peptidase [Ilumatobacteraceae bacterium]
MCGRFVSSNRADTIADFFGASFDSAITAPLQANYNVAPTTEVYGVTADTSGVRAVEVFRWGLVPPWAKDSKIASTMINARAETVAEKPAFKGLVKKHRLLIPMDGFYEWKRPADGPKQPMFIHRVDGLPLAVAGLWAAWRDRSGPDDAPWLHTCTVITTAANDMMRPVHDRMPVILPASTWDRWLDPASQDLDGLRGMLRAAPNSLLTMHPVSVAVNSVRNNGPELIDPLDPAALL